MHVSSHFWLSAAFLLGSFITVGCSSGDPVATQYKQASAEASGPAANNPGSDATGDGAGSGDEGRSDGDGDNAELISAGAAAFQTASCNLCHNEGQGGDIRNKTDAEGLISAVDMDEHADVAARWPSAEEMDAIEAFLNQ